MSADLGSGSGSGEGGRIEAPWTEEQVRSLNEYQRSGVFHPFTGARAPDGGEVVLIATTAGWVEREGGPVVQAWAWAWMAAASKIDRGIISSMERTEQERNYDAIVDSCVWKVDGHVQRRAASLEPGRVRLYGVTTIAASTRFGGTRTPVVCTTFERARIVVEQNEGDVWEGSYMLVVIETFESDCLYSQIPEETYWYKWDRAEKRYRPIEVPDARLRDRWEID